jgi:hypothetical protein
VVAFHFTEVEIEVQGVQHLSCCLSTRIPKGLGGIAQVVQHLPSIREALGSLPSMGMGVQGGGLQPRIPTQFCATLAQPAAILHTMFQNP